MKRTAVKLQQRGGTRWTKPVVEGGEALLGKWEALPESSKHVSAREPPFPGQARHKHAAVGTLPVHFPYLGDKQLLPDADQSHLGGGEVPPRRPRGDSPVVVAVRSA